MSKAEPVVPEQEPDALLSWWEGKMECPHEETVSGLARDCLPCLRALFVVPEREPHDREVWLDKAAERVETFLSVDLDLDREPHDWTLDEWKQVRAIARRAIASMFQPSTIAALAAAPRAAGGQRESMTKAFIEAIQEHPFDGYTLCKCRREKFDIPMEELAKKYSVVNRYVFEVEQRKAYAEHIAQVAEGFAVRLAAAEPQVEGKT